MALKVLIYWKTRDEQKIARIRRRFNIPKYVTVNGWNPAEIQDCDFPLFKETASRGFFRFRRQEWSFNGSTYSWSKMV